MEERNLRKEMIGTVVSDKMDKTVVVAVETSEMNKMYGKIQNNKYKKEETQNGTTTKYIKSC